MKTLILNVDRDNDYGIKVNVTGPVIGYAECYNAAMKMISTDPEESDANALFGAVHHYETLKSRGEDVEIALITGDEDVGERSDEVISHQLDEVLSSGEFSDVVLVTDGAEDDYIIPLIVSRVKIRYVKHIIVRHNENIESVYYYIVRALKDKKLVNKIIIPFGLVFLTYGIVSLILLILSMLVTGSKAIPSSSGAVTFVTIVLGGYFVERGFNLGNRMLQLLSSFKKYAEETRVSFISYVVAASLVLSGITASYVGTTQYFSVPLDAVLVFFSYFVWWLYAAVFAIESGNAVEMLLTNRTGVKRIIYGLAFSLAVAMVIFGMLNYIRYELGYTPFSFAASNVIILISGIIIAVASSIVHRYYSDNGNEDKMTPLERSIFDEK